MKVCHRNKSLTRKVFQSTCVCVYDLSCTAKEQMQNPCDVSQFFEQFNQFIIDDLIDLYASFLKIKISQVAIVPPRLADSQNAS
jgi:hypothetical protein